MYCLSELSHWDLTLGQCVRVIDVTVPVQLLSSGAESESGFWQPVQLLHWTLKHPRDLLVINIHFTFCGMFFFFPTKKRETLFSRHFRLSVIFLRAIPTMSIHQSPGTCCVPPPAALIDTVSALSPHTTVAAYLQVSSSDFRCLRIGSVLISFSYTCFQIQPTVDCLLAPQWQLWWGIQYIPCAVIVFIPATVHL